MIRVFTFANVKLAQVYLTENRILILVLEVHSGDATLVTPPQDLNDQTIE